MSENNLNFKIWIPYDNMMLLPKTILVIHEQRLNGPTVGQTKQWVYRQSTGKRDEDKVEVFDGDIIRTPSGNIVEVFFGDKEYTFGDHIIECTGWLVRRINVGYRKGEVETLDSSMFGKIIGNKYQNPELL